MPVLVTNREGWEGVTIFFCSAVYCSVHTPIDNAQRHAQFDQRTDSTEEH